MSFANSGPDANWPVTAAARISRLNQRLRGKGYHPQIPDDEAHRLVVPGRASTVHVVAKRRDTDENRLWYFMDTGPGEAPTPIAQADGDHDEDALITITDKAGDPPVEPW